MYHRLIAPGETSPSYFTVTEEEFIKQLDYLKAEGYHTITAQELYDYMTKDKVLPAKPIILSFDDSYPSDYKISYPLLKARGLKGVFFVIVGKLNKPDYQTWWQEMSQNGMDIESHTLTHQYMGGSLTSSGGIRKMVFPEVFVRRELVLSKERLEKILGKPVRFLAWPGDSYSDETVKLAQEAGYRGLFMAKTEKTENVLTLTHNVSGFNYYSDSPLYIRRIAVTKEVSFDEFKEMLRLGYYPYVSPKINLPLTKN